MEKYRERLEKELKKYGFALKGGKLTLIEDIRKVQLRLAETTNLKYRKLKTVVGKYFASSIDEIDPLKIRPRLDFYAKSFWSVPVSSGYGRRMDYILWDDNTGKVIGIFGLCDPVIGLGVRDKFIGWDKELKEKRLYNIMTAYILGAVPPYNQILGAKLVALSAISKEVVEDFKRRYEGTTTTIRKEKKLPYLVAVDTLGAFGKSAIYTRLKGWKFVGYTKGQSHLHLTLNGIYRILLEVIEKFGDGQILRKYRFGEGPNYKMRVVSEALKILGLKRNNLTTHSIKRAYYFAPLAKNWKDFLLGKTDAPELTADPLEENFNYWRQRWLPKGLKRLGRFYF